MLTRIISIGTLPLLLAGVCMFTACATETQQLTFATPEAAAVALHDACRNRDRDELERIFGPDMEKLASGDRRQDQADFQRFAAALDRKWALKRESDSDPEVYLVIGEQAWQFPAPIVNENGKWRFDTAQGIEDMDDVRVGNSELSAIRTCGAYVQAQQAYLEMNPEGGVKSYAAKIRSSPGRRDGLWWPDSPDAPRSPLGPLVAAAVDRRELDTATQARQPYRGYYFKPLVRQGAGASGGAREYIDSNGHMTNGFALIAWPAVYGKTGVMTFIVSQDGVVLQRNLGEDTARLAESTTTFDPAGWMALAPPP